MGAIRPAEQYRRESFTRMRRILECYRGCEEEYGIRDFGQILGIRHQTAHDICQALVAEGILEQDQQTAQYRLGPWLREMGKRATLSFAEIQAGDTLVVARSPAGPGSAETG